MCQQELGGRLLREQIFFQELQAGDGIERILAYLDNNILIAIPTAERLETKVAVTVSEILENYPESFFNQNFRKRYKNTEAKQNTEVSRRCSVDVLKNFVRFTEKYLCRKTSVTGKHRSLFLNKVSG